MIRQPFCNRCRFQVIGVYGGQRSSTACNCALQPYVETNSAPSKRRAEPGLVATSIQDAREAPAREAFHITRIQSGRILSDWTIGFLHGRGAFQVKKIVYRVHGRTVQDAAKSVGILCPTETAGSLRAPKACAAAPSDIPEWFRNPSLGLRTRVSPFGAG